MNGQILVAGVSFASREAGKWLESMHVETIQELCISMAHYFLILGSRCDTSAMHKNFDLFTFISILMKNCKKIQTDEGKMRIFFLEDEGRGEEATRRWRVKKEIRSLFIVEVGPNLFQQKPLALSTYSAFINKSEEIRIKKHKKIN